VFCAASESEEKLSRGSEEKGGEDPRKGNAGLPELLNVFEAA
jgi:hypothetical protein